MSVGVQWVEDNIVSLNVWQCRFFFKYFHLHFCLIKSLKRKHLQGFLAKGGGEFSSEQIEAETWREAEKESVLH